MGPLPVSLPSDPKKSRLEMLPIKPLPIAQPLPNGLSIIDSNSRGELPKKQTQTKLGVYSRRNKKSQPSNFFK